MLYISESYRDVLSIELLSIDVPKLNILFIVEIIYYI